MKPPRTYETLLGWIFLILGTAFTLMGLVFPAFNLPVKNGGARSFVLGGLPLLGFGLIPLCAAWQKERSWNRLRSEGRAVQGKLVPEATRRHRYTSFGSDGIHKRSPWSVMCIYRWEGRTYSVRSEFLWQKPREGEQQVTVYVDPLNPQRAWLDPKTLAYEVPM